MKGRWRLIRVHGQSGRMKLACEELVRNIANHMPLDTQRWRGSGESRIRTMASGRDRQHENHQRKGPTSEEKKKK